MRDAGALNKVFLKLFKKNFVECLVGSGDLADGEREVVRHDREVEDDDHMVHLGNYTHTAYLACYCRQNLVSSLPRGMIKVVDCR